MSRQNASCSRSKSTTTTNHLPPSALVAAAGQYIPSQQTRDIEPLLVQCLVRVLDGGPTFNQQWLNILCLLGNFCLLFKKNTISVINQSDQQLVIGLSDL